MRILQIEELGFHNRLTAGRCLIAIVDGGGVAGGPLRPELIAPLRETLTAAGAALGETLGEAELSFPALHAALAAALQRHYHDKPWRHGELPTDNDRRSAVFLECGDPTLARHCLHAALRLAETLVAGGDAPLEERAAMLRELLAKRLQILSLAPLPATAREIIAEAEARGIPWRRVWSATPHYMLGHGSKLTRMRSMMCDMDGILGAEISHNKILTSRLLAKAGLPVPRAGTVSSADVAVELAKQIGYPVVVKPNLLLKGAGVAVGLDDEEEVRRAYDAAAEYDAGVNVERLIPGDDHRILIVDGRFIAAVRREPPKVVGDGRSTLHELIAEENRNPLRRDNRRDDLLVQIVADTETERLIARAGLTLDSVPAEGQVVTLKATSNIATGGTAVDVTDSIHPDNVALAVRAALTIDVAVAGIDYITTDIGRSFRETGGRICEVNAWVSLAPHRIAEPKRDVIGPLVDRRYAPGDDGRIPIAVTSGDHAQSAVAERLAAILNAAGQRCGEATENGARIGGAVIALGNHASHRGAKVLLNNPDSEAVALALDLDNFATRGLPFDRCTAVALLGVSALDAPRREAARRLAAAASDALIIEADDAAALEIAQTLEGRRTILVATQGLGPHLRRHLDGGGEAVLAETGGGGATSLLYRAGKAREVLLPALAAPDADALAAAALALALGQPASAIAAGFAAAPEGARHAV